MNHIFEHNRSTRQLFKDLLENHTAEELNRIPKGFKNNMIWNIIHSMTSQQGLVYGLSSLEQNLPKELSTNYKNGSVPEEFVTEDRINEYKSLLFPLIEKTQADYQNGLFKEFTEYTTSTNYTMRNVEEALGMNNIHEAIHLGYALAIRKALKDN